MADEGYPLQHRAPRVQVQAVQLDLAPGVVLNLSEVGALLELPVRIEVCSTLSFRLESDGFVVTLHARVMRSEALRDVHARVEWDAPDRYQIGVEFIDVSDQSRMTVRDVLRKAG